MRPRHMDPLFPPRARQDVAGGSYVTRRTPVKTKMDFPETSAGRVLTWSEGDVGHTPIRRSKVHAWGWERVRPGRENPGLREELLGPRSDPYL